MRIFSLLTHIIQLFLLVGICLPPMCAASDGSVEIAAGFLSADGQQLIIPGQNLSLDTQAPLYAIFADNQAVPACFLVRQEETPQNTHRCAPDNFAHLSGYIFTLAQPGNSGQSCFLTTQSFIDGREFIPYQALPGSCSEAELVGIEAAKQRPVEESGGIALLADGRKLFLVKFAALGDDALASLVLIDERGGLIFRDYPAKVQQGSTWRVDDGGEIRPAQFRLIFVSTAAGRPEIGYEFLGAEGSSLEIAAADNGQFRTVVRGYRYTSPF